VYATDAAPVVARTLEARVAEDVAALCLCRDRHVGSSGNRAATARVERRLRNLGLEVASREFECIDWTCAGAHLEADGEAFAVQSGPYSNPVDVRAPLVAAATIDDLEARVAGGTVAGAVLLLHGPICRDPLTPKRFPFFEMPGHRRIVELLEVGRPAAVVAATGRNPDLAGATYPFPFVNDGDFDLPNAYLTDVEGERLLIHAGGEVTLRLDASRFAARARHVVAQLPGDAPGRIVVCGHVDSKEGAPGALDNATGVAILLGVAELLAAGRPAGTPRHGPTVEFVPFNGEDHYSAAGEKLYVAENDGRWEDIIVALNADGAGWAGHPPEVSLYGCEAGLAATIRDVMARYPGLAEGEQWPQSDHSIFAMQGRPAVAVTSADFGELCATITHTDRDVPALVDAAAVASVARFFADVVAALS
jgi:aminopeptidase YwaD